MKPYKQQVQRWCDDLLAAMTRVRDEQTTLLEMNGIEGQRALVLAWVNLWERSGLVDVLLNAPFKLSFDPRQHLEAFERFHHLVAVTDAQRAILGLPCEDFPWVLTSEAHGEDLPFTTA